MKNIAINQPRTSYFIGGAEMISMEHARIISQMGYKVTFFTIKPKSINCRYSKQYLKFKAKYHEIIDFHEVNQDKNALFIYGIRPGENRIRWDNEALFYNRALFSELAKRSNKYDFMLSYYNFDALVIPTQKIAKNILYLCGIPRDENVFRTSLLNMYDKIFAITEETKKYWQKYTEKNISVIPTGVDYNRFKPNKHPSKKTTILFLGRLIELKGCDRLICAISKLPKTILSNVRVQIIGDGPQKNILKEMIDNLSLGKYIKIIGVVDNPEHYLSTADICVFPSSYGEGLTGRDSRSNVQWSWCNCQ